MLLYSHDVDEYLDNIVSVMCECKYIPEDIREEVINLNNNKDSNIEWFIVNKIILRKFVFCVLIIMYHYISERCIVCAYFQST